MIFDTAKQLGLELHNSEAYQNLLNAQNALQQDSQAYAILTGMKALEEDIKSLMEQPDGSEQDMADKMELYHSIREQAAQNATIAAFQAASQEFDGIMEQVNNIISFQLTGTIPESASSCTGNCATCGGSCGHH